MTSAGRARDHGTAANGASSETALGAAAAILDRAGLEPLPDEQTRSVIAKCPLCLASTAADYYPLTVAVGRDGTFRVHCGRGCDRVAVLAAIPELAPAPSLPEKLRVLDVGKMLDEPPPPVPWVVESLLVAGCVTMLAGREGQGKSMLALALAAAVGHGSTLAGLDCQTSGTVLYVDAENGEHEAHRRVHGLDVKRDTLTYVEANRFNLVADVALIDALVGEHTPQVLVLDSLRSLAPGLDENDSQQAEAALRPVSRLAQKHRVPVLILHHAGKNGHEYRGSTALGAAVELGFTLSRHDDDPDKQTRRRLSCWKCRPAVEPPARWLTLQADGDRILIGEADPFVPQPDAPVQDELVVGLRAWITRHTRGDTTEPPPPWALADLAAAVGRRRDDRTLRRAIDRLAADGALHRVDDKGGWWPAAPLPGLEPPSDSQHDDERDE